jgi:glycosyltransferase involved in cell wall biosynthesis
MERAVVRSATRLVFVNDYTRDRVMAKYPAEWRSRTHVIPQGHAGPSPAMPRSDGPLRLVYTGRFYDGVRDPGVFLEAVAEVHRASALDGRIAIEFIGSRMDAHAQQASALGLDRVVQFRSRVSPDQARQLAASSDVLLVIDAPSEGPSLFLPSKLIDYLPLEKPILGITPLRGPSGDLIRELGYPVVDPLDRAGIVQALRQLLDAHDSGSLTISPRHPEVAAQYDMQAIGAAFDQVLSTAVARA